MSWRNNAQQTGSNNIPLGKRRNVGGGAGGPPEPAEAYIPLDQSGSGDNHKRGRSPQRDVDQVDAAIDGIKRRKKRNRWGDASDNKAAGLMGLPTLIKAKMTAEQLDVFILHLRIEEISQKLRINDVVPPERDRSPSPPPQYDNQGRRVNTREYRYRKRLEDERHKLVERAIKEIPSYRPPADYKRPTKTQEKVYVPVNDYPEINFIGLLIGPRGNTLKKMEGESGAKIAIRGKGSVKEGKGRSDAAHTSNQEEDLHCLIMADTEEKVNKAKQAVHQVIETAASIPEGQNSLKRNQLRELAALNGTLRDDENQACQNCGEIGHRKYDCPQQRNFTANIICRVCGNAGHMARDCPDRQRGQDWRGETSFNSAGRIGAGPMGEADKEYEALMAELNGGGAIGNASGANRLEAGSGEAGEAASRPAPAPKPWERGPTGAPAPWNNRNRDNGHGGGNHGPPTGAPPPWQQRGGHGGHDSQAGGYGGGYHQSYDAGASSGGAAPWQQHSQQAYYGNNQQQGYGGYGNYNYAQQQQQQQSYNLPPGMAPWQQNYSTGYDQAPPPPPPGAAGLPPPPPPPGQSGASHDEPPPPPPPPPPGA